MTRQTSLVTAAVSIASRKAKYLVTAHHTKNLLSDIQHLASRSITEWGCNKALWHGAKDGIVSADRWSILIVVCLGVTHLIELRLQGKQSE